MHLHERAAQLEQAGRLPQPSRDYANVDSYDGATHVLIRLGYQPATGRYLYLYDLDTHHAGQNAARATGLAAIRDRWCGPDAEFIAGVRKMTTAIDRVLNQVELCQFRHEVGCVERSEARRTRPM